MTTFLIDIDVFNLLLRTYFWVSFIYIFLTYSAKNMDRGIFKDLYSRHIISIKIGKFLGNHFWNCGMWLQSFDSFARTVGPSKQYMYRFQLNVYLKFDWLVTD